MKFWLKNSVEVSDFRVAKEENFFEKNLDTQKTSRERLPWSRNVRKRRWGFYAAAAAAAAAAAVHF